MIRTFAVILLLIVVTAAVYWQVRSHDFVYYDDQEYVFENAHIHDGLTLKGVRWAFTTTYAANWHPLTWLSHMADQQVFGGAPAGPHLVNVLLHILSSVMLMVVLLRMTGAFWQSALVAALFAIHPLHVESVAWVAERKDVLSTFLFMLTLLLYVRYVEHPAMTRYLASLSCFFFGLMAKPMLVTLPFVLLLLDFWPLKRFDHLSFLRNMRQSVGKSLARIVLEKLPFFLLSVLSSVITVVAQQSAMPSFRQYPPGFRMGNAINSYATYLIKMIWPSDLAVFYPLASQFDPWKLAGAGTLLVAVSLWAVTVSRKRPYILVGWLWYLGTLVPVIGIVQVGSQSMADRYTYVPSVGIFIMTAWGLSEAVARWSRLKTTAVASAVMVLIALSALTWVQIGYWKNTFTLFTRCVSVTQNNHVALGVLGKYLLKKEQPAEALVFLQQSLALKRDDAEVQHGIGTALFKLGREAEAAAYISNAVRLNPKDARAHHDLGILMRRSGDSDGAVREFQEAVRIEPDDLSYHFELGVSLVDAGRLDEAIEQYTEVLRQDPAHANAHVNVGVALARKGNMSEAIEHFSRAVELAPTDETARQNLELARRRLVAVKSDRT
ncbi:MAG TPA: tetratricopeptide repeat protein [Thermodesulfovibrionales bacterium]|nr:tetratricopeptide repeat protein [Thermodesulfovibrionales bacterium]